MNFVKRLHDAGWLRVRESTQADDRLLSCCRITTGLFLLFLHPAKNAWVGELPQALYDPPILSLGSLLSGFPSVFTLQLGDTITTLALCTLTLGIRSRMSCIVFTIAHLLGSTFAYSFGKIDHNILLPMAVFCLFFSNAGCYNALLPDRPKSYRLRGESLLALLITFGMFTAGFPKSLIWVDFDLSQSGFMSWFVEGYYSLGRKHLLAPVVMQLPAIFVESFDYVAVLFELLPFVMLILGRRFWRGWVVFALLFHLTSALLLNIASYVHMPVYLPFVITLVPWQENTKRRLRNVAFFAALIVTIVHLVAIWTNFEFASLQVYLLPTFETQLYFYTVCWCGYLAYAAYSYRQMLRGISSNADSATA